MTSNLSNSEDKNEADGADNMTNIRIQTENKMNNKVKH